MTKGRTCVQQTGHCSPDFLFREKDEVWVLQDPCPGRVAWICVTGGSLVPGTQLALPAYLQLNCRKL